MCNGVKPHTLPTTSNRRSDAVMSKDAPLIYAGLPPITLQFSCFTRVHWDAVLGFDVNAGISDHEMLSLYTVSSGIAEGVGDAGEIGVQLTLSTHPDAGTRLPYTVDLEMRGVFAVSPSVPPDKVQELVRSVGTGTLYTAAREYLLMVTGRGPNPPLLLPTRSFVRVSAPPKPGKKKKAGS